MPTPRHTYTTILFAALLTAKTSSFAPVKNNGIGSLRHRRPQTCYRHSVQRASLPASVEEDGRKLELTKDQRDEIDFLVSQRADARRCGRRESTAGKSKVCRAHFPNLPVNATILSRGAMVSTCNHNFEPEWGLFNNSVGKVEEIVFEPGHNPNAGDHPCYVAVSFPQHSGPAWDDKKPKVSDW